MKAPTPQERPPGLLTALGAAIEAARNARATCATCGKRLPEQADPKVNVYCSPRCYGIARAEAERGSDRG